MLHGGNNGSPSLTARSGPISAVPPQNRGPETQFIEQVDRDAVKRQKTATRDDANHEQQLASHPEQPLIGGHGNQQITQSEETPGSAGLQQVCSRSMAALSHFQPGKAKLQTTGDH